MNILIIAGHGDEDCGAVGNGYKEADITREVATLLKAELNGYAEVTIADTKKNWFNYLKTKYFNFQPYDYVLEIHFNAGGGTGTEIYITESEKTHGVETEIVKAISNIGFKNRGVKRENWSVISKVKNQGVSAALLEVCFIDSANDMNLYQTKKKEIIGAIAKGIVNGFGLKKAVDDLTEACNTLAAKGIINSPDYWATGKGYSDENTILLIKKFAKYVKGA